MPRTGLNLPISTAPDQPYGEATDQANAQRSVPMGASPVAPVPVGRPLPKPGSLPYISPTERPDEPVTSGIDFGPGPGSEALGSQAPDPQAQLARAASMTGSETLSNLAALASLSGM